jgi:protein-L-isoaspartate(D-aspartate) O-methyltransferase
LIKHVVGRRGRVVAVDIDPDTAKRASSALRSGRYPVTVRAADGRKGWKDGAPYDRIIVTASSPTVPRFWLRQLVQGGVLVMPLRLTEATPGPHAVVAFRRDRQQFCSESVIPGGFMALRDAPDGDSIAFPIAQVLERVAGKVKSVHVSGVVVERMSHAARRRLMTTLCQSPRLIQVARGTMEGLGGLSTFVALAGPAACLVEGEPWNVGLVDREGGGAALLNYKGKGGRARVGIRGFGSHRTERELRRLVEQWRALGRPTFGALRIGVTYAGARGRAKAWRTSRRDSCTLSFNWAPR